MFRRFGHCNRETVVVKDSKEDARRKNEKILSLRDVIFVHLNYDAQENQNVPIYQLANRRTGDAQYVSIRVCKTEKHPDIIAIYFMDVSKSVEIMELLEKITNQKKKKEQNTIHHPMNLISYISKKRLETSLTLLENLKSRPV